MPRKRTSRKANSLLSAYGQCPVCEAPIVYPGLDGFKCRDCGWLKVTEVALAIKKRATALAKYTKQNSAKAVDTSPSLSSVLNNSAIIANTVNSS